MIAECVHQQHANCSAWSAIGAIDWKQVPFKICLLPTKDSVMNVSRGVSLTQQSCSDWLSVSDGLLHILSQGTGSRYKLSFASCAAAAVTGIKGTKSSLGYRNAYFISELSRKKKKKGLKMQHSPCWLPWQPTWGGAGMSFRSLHVATWHVEQSGGNFPVSARRP